MFLGKTDKKSKSNDENCTNCHGGGRTGDLRFNMNGGVPCKSCGGSGKKADQQPQGTT